VPRECEAKVASTREPDYERLLTFRKALRDFLRWSEQAASDAGLTPAQHQLLLAIKGHGGGAAPTITDVADDLRLRHHSASELIQRAEAGGLLRRRTDPADRRVARLSVTAAGERLLRHLAAQHLDEVRRLAPIVAALDRD
jgi:DNA-binding MarR family transcriptional regulator